MKSKEKTENYLESLKIDYQEFSSNMHQDNEYLHGCIKTLEWVLKDE